MVWFSIIILVWFLIIIYTLKTSFRERWKQADLESEALKNVYRKAKSYLITLDEDADIVSDKIEEGDAFAIDKIVRCDTEDINCLIDELRGLRLCESPLISGNKKGNYIG